MITVIGNILDSSGYARHTRELANALNKITEVSLQSSLTQGWERQVNDAELEMIKRETDNQVNLIITNPLYWKINLTAKYNMVYLVWEGNKIPKWMADECFNSNIDKIIVPSKHTYDALVNGLQQIDYSFKVDGTDVRQTILDKTVIIPHGVDINKFYPISQCRNLGSNPSQREETVHSQSRGRLVVKDAAPIFKFLMCKGFTNMEDRGGVQYGIQAYLSEFSKKDNVELIIKINSVYGIPDFDKLFPELKKKDNPKITLITETLDDKQLNQLYNDCDVFVSPTRAEAFNLPVLESLATGTPTIVTNYGGQTDFVDVECGWLIPYKLEEIKHDMMYEGIKWATIDIKKLSCAMRFTYKNQEIVKAMSGRAVSMAKCLTWDNTAKIIVNLLERGVDTRG